MASVDQLPSGKWRVRFSRSGKRSTRTFSTEDEARIFERELTEKAFVPSRLDAFAGRWFQANKGRWKPSTATRYRDSLNLYVLPQLGDRDLTELTPALVREWQAELLESRAPRTVNGARTLLSSVLKTAMVDGLLPQGNPVPLVPGPKVTKKPIRILTEPEINKVANAIEPRWRALIFVGAYAGLRIGELCALEVNHVDLANRKIHVRNTVTRVGNSWHIGRAKTNASQRTITMPQLVVGELERHLEQGYGSADGFVFSGARGRTRTDPGWFRTSPWARMVEASGIDGLTPHDLRHTAVSLWIRAGASSNLVAQWAGHTDPAFVLKTYGHLFGDEGDALAAKLDEGVSLIG